MVKKQSDNAKDITDAGSVPGSGRSPGGGHGNPLQYSCLENPMDRDWWATVHSKQVDTTEVTYHACTHRMNETNVGGQITFQSFQNLVLNRNYKS